MFLLEALKQQGTLSSSQNYEISQLWHKIVETLPGNITLLQTWYQRLRARQLPDGEYRILMQNIQALCNNFTGGGWYSRPIGDAAMPPLEQDSLDRLAGLIQGASRGGSDRYAIQEIFSIFQEYRGYMTNGDVAQLALYRNFHQQGIPLDGAAWDYMDQLLERIKQQIQAQAVAAEPQEGSYDPFKSATPSVASNVLDPFQRPDIPSAHVIQPVAAQMGGAPAIMPPPTQPPAQHSTAVVPFQPPTDVAQAQPAPVAGGQRPARTFPVQQAQMGGRPAIMPAPTSAAVAPFQAPTTDVVQVAPSKPPAQQAEMGAIPALPAPPPRDPLTGQTGALVPLAPAREQAQPLPISVPQQSQPLIETGSVSSFNTDDYENIDPSPEPQEAPQFARRPIEAFASADPAIFSPPESHVSAALQPSANELENFLQDTDDILARIPVEGFVNEKRREGVSDQDIALQLGAINPSFTQAAFEERFPRIPAEASPVLYLQAPVAQYKALPDVAAKKGRYDVLTTRLESLNTSNQRDPGDKETVQEIADVRREMRQLSEQYDFDPPVTVVSDSSDIAQRREDVLALQATLKSQTANVDQHIARNDTAINNEEEELQLVDAEYKLSRATHKRITADLQAKTSRYRQKEQLYLSHGNDRLRKDVEVLSRQKIDLTRQRRRAFAAMEQHKRQLEALTGKIDARKSQQANYKEKRRRLLERSATAQHDIKMLGGKRRRAGDAGAETTEEERDRKRRDLKLHEDRRVALLDEGSQSNIRKKKARRPEPQKHVPEAEQDEKYNPPAEKTVAVLPQREREYRDFTPVTELPAIHADDIRLTQEQIDKAKTQSRQHFQEEIRDAKSDLKRTSGKYVKDIKKMEELTNKPLGRFTRGEAEKLILMRDRVIQDKGLSKQDGDTLIKIAKRFMKKAGMHVLHMDSRTRILRPDQLAIFRKIIMKAHDGQFKVTPQFAHAILQVLGGRSTTYKAKFERISESLEKNKTAVQEQKHKIAFSQKILGEWNIWKPIKQKRQRKKKTVKEGRKLLLLKQRKEASPEPPAVPQPAPEEPPRTRRRMTSPVPDFSQAHPELDKG